MALVSQDPGTGQSAEPFVVDRLDTGNAGSDCCPCSLHNRCPYSVLLFSIVQHQLSEGRHIPIELSFGNGSCYVWSAVEVSPSEVGDVDCIVLGEATLIGSGSRLVLAYKSLPLLLGRSINGE